MLQGWAKQYECPSVVLDGPRVPDEVIKFAREIGAECNWEIDLGQDPDLVVDLKYLGDTGPEVFTEEALRGQLVRDLAAST